MVGGSFMLRALRAVERWALNRTDLVLVLSEHMRAQLEARKVTTPIRILPIWIDTDAIYPKPPAEGETLKVLYSGNFGRKQGLHQILDAAHLLQQRAPEITIVLRGEGREAQALMETARAAGLANIEFSPLMPPSQLNDALAEGDIHLVPQNPQAADFAVPSKIFAIMAAGRPFVATAQPGSLLWQLCEEAGAFVCVPPNDPEAFARALLTLAGDPALRAELGARGRAYVLAHHAKPKVLHDFLTAVGGA